MAEDPQSISAIAASMLVPANSAPPTPNRQGASDPAAQTPASAPGETDEDEGQQLQADDATEDGDGRPDEGTAPEQDDAGSDDDDAPALEVKGDPWIEVKIDGELMHIRLSELKSSYSGTEVIAKRLQEATEARNEAVRARDVAVEQERGAAKEILQREVETLRTQTQQLAAVYQHYGNALLQPKVQAPDEALRSSDPIGYLTQMDAFRQDQGRLQMQSAHMQEIVQQAEAQEAQKRTEFVQEQLTRLVEEVPAMRNPEYRKQQLGRVRDIGMAVGFTPEEVRVYANDRRVIYLAMLAAKGAEDMMKVRQGGVPTVKPKANIPTQKATIRAANGQFKQKNATLEQAKNTGDYRDVAKTMMVSASAPGKTRRG